MSEYDDNLWDKVRVAASKILFSEEDVENTVKELRDLYFQLGFPEELAAWAYLHDGHSDEYYDSTWFPGLTTYNHEKWLATVKKEARTIIDRTQCTETGG